MLLGRNKVTTKKEVLTKVSVEMKWKNTVISGLVGWDKRADFLIVVCCQCGLK